MRVLFQHHQVVGVTPEKGKSSERKRKRKTAMESGDAGRSYSFALCVDNSSNTTPKITLLLAVSND